MADAEGTHNPLAAIAAAKAALEPERPLFVPLDFMAGWESEADLPDYVVDGLIARGEIALLSADTGAGKSWLAQALTVAVLHGHEWLGRHVAKGCVLYIDEENPERIPLSRLRALGLIERDLSDLRYFSRQGIAIGDGAASDQALRTVLQSFTPSLVVIDTTMAATAISDINDNTAVVRFYSAIRAVAEEHGFAAVLLHHERKLPAGAADSYDQAHAAMGARQLAGQADVHITVRRIGGEVTTDDDVVRQTTSLKLAFPKLRDGGQPEAEYAQIQSLTMDDRLQAATLDVCEQPASDLAIDIAMLVRAGDGEMKTAEIAATLGCSGRDGKFKAAITQALQRDWIARPEGSSKGKYVAGPVAPEVDDDENEPAL